MVLQTVGRHKHLDWRIRNDVFYADNLYGRKIIRKSLVIFIILFRIKKEYYRFWACPAVVLRVEYGLYQENVVTYFIY